MERRSLLRGGLWWGLLAWAGIAGTLSLAGPVRSHAAIAVSLLAIAVGAGLSVAVVRRARRSGETGWPRLLRGAVGTASGLAVAYLAVAALGPATNYDTGLYHLGAIRYASEFGTVPGLANLYFGYGYANAQFPLAALLGNLPWGGEGWRLLNGLVVVVAVADLLLRLREPRRAPGTFMALPGIALALVALVALSDYWVTSPTSDTPVLLLTLAFLAAATDAVAGRSLRRASAVMIPTAALLALLRPTTVIVAVAGFAVVAIVARRERAAALRPAIALVATAAGALALATARDRLLSGWIQYPLSVASFDVPWRAADPVGNRLATLGTARDAADLWGAAQGYGWIGPWVARLPGQWETWAVLLLATVAVGVSWSARSRLRGRRMLLALAPPAIGTVAWFLLSPPSYRFGWGVVFGLPLVALGWALWRAARSRELMTLLAAGFAAPVALVVAVSAIWRLDTQAMSSTAPIAVGPITVAVPIAAVGEAPSVPVATDAGLTVLVPTLSDQCWATYPLCTPQPDGALRPLGDELSAGLSVQRP